MRAEQAAWDVLSGYPLARGARATTERPVAIAQKVFPNFV
jgi:hypothetical protein